MSQVSVVTPLVVVGSQPSGLALFLSNMLTISVRPRLHASYSALVFKITLGLFWICMARVMSPLLKLVTRSASLTRTARAMGLTSIGPGMPMYSPSIDKFFAAARPLRRFLGLLVWIYVNSVLSRVNIDLYSIDGI